MRARQLIFEAAGPERLKVFLKAFDDAWDTIAGNFGDDPEVVEAARAKLAKVILNLPISDTSVEAITYSPTDCNVEPSQVALGYCRAAEALGVTTLPHTGVVGFDVREDGYPDSGLTRLQGCVKVRQICKVNR